MLDEAWQPVVRGIGEIVLRGTALMIGYWHNSEEEEPRAPGEGFLDA